MKGSPRRLPPRRHLIRWFRLGTVIAWLVVITVIATGADADSRERLVFQVALTLGAGGLGIPALIALLGDRLRTVADAYLIGYAHGREDAGLEDDGEDDVTRRPFLRVVE